MQILSEDTNLRSKNMKIISKVAFEFPYIRVYISTDLFSYKRGG